MAKNNGNQMNPMLQMFLPMALKMLKNPNLKVRLLELFAKHKAKYIRSCDDDVRIELSCTNEDILAKTVLYDKFTGEVKDVFVVYNFEELVELLSKIKL